MPVDGPFRRSGMGQLKEEGGARHRGPAKDDDDNATWNGNSTQQL